MKLFMVRHGRTTHNEVGRFQPIDSELSEEGVRQAAQIGERLKDISFDKVYSSDSNRAVETARRITNDGEIVKTEVLRPVKLPSEMIGLEHEDPKVKQIYKQIDRYSENAKWHYSDEENFYDFYSRITSFFEMLADEKEKNVLAVTHSLVVRLSVCYVLLKEDLSATLFRKLRFRLHAGNTGITVFSFENDEWKLESFNDVTHL